MPCWLCSDWLAVSFFFVLPLKMLNNKSKYPINTGKIKSVKHKLRFLPIWKIQFRPSWKIFFPSLYYPSKAPGPHFSRVSSHHTAPHALTKHSETTVTVFWCLIFVGFFGLVMYFCVIPFWAKTKEWSEHWQSIIWDINISKTKFHAKNRTIKWDTSTWIYKTGMEVLQESYKHKLCTSLNLHPVCFD